MLVAAGRQPDQNSFAQARVSAGDCQEQTAAKKKIRRQKSVSKYEVAKKAIILAKLLAKNERNFGVSKIRVKFGSAQIFRAKN